jgi:hypothetical protein
VSAYGHDCWCLCNAAIRHLRWAHQDHDSTVRATGPEHSQHFHSPAITHLGSHHHQRYVNNHQYDTAEDDVLVVEKVARQEASNARLRAASEATLCLVDWPRAGAWRW